MFISVLFIVFLLHTSQTNERKHAQVITCNLFRINILYLCIYMYSTYIAQFIVGYFQCLFVEFFFFFLPNFSIGIINFDWKCHSSPCPSKLHHSMFPVVFDIVLCRSFRMQIHLLTLFNATHPRVNELAFLTSIISITHFLYIVRNIC